MTKLSLETAEWARKLWSYNHLGQESQPADFIFVMCSYNLLVADRAAELFQKGMGEFIAVSGGIAHQDDLLDTGWDQAEAIIFSERLMALGVNEDDIIIEDKARNSGENIIYTKALLEQRSKSVQSGLIVQKPYMERRAFATAQKQWVEVDWRVTSPALTYDEYIENNNEERLINILVGDTQRVIDYADKGFQTVQQMPEDIVSVLERLKEHGFTKHL